MVRTGNISDTTCFQLTLVEEFSLRHGGRQLELPHMAERVLTYLALLDRPVARSRLAGALWPGCADSCASKSLRTALWRLRRAQEALVQLEGDRLRLGPGVSVDLAELTGLARRLIHDPGPEDLARVPLLLQRKELLPDWDEDWMIADREHYRLNRIMALESAAQVLLERRQAGAALIAASAVVQQEPLRESSRRIVMQIHLSQGNEADAIREYRCYRDLLGAEFGAVPSSRMDDLLLPIRRRRYRHVRLASVRALGAPGETLR
ncbi:SARP family transcriptional regulator [Nocardia beijingensis]|uniref:AfsR/SARP family transcriptional regulator n=1 Tax=Nocardia beijingensis TaxID=95162 RepID=UPI001892F7B7|nr:BTAD domain-containing putative transcriptional regulator [Nocardia beijingensis]MBF6465691.1 SARP family transcriptional regulator [Nocardia beijingensis]